MGAGLANCSGSTSQAGETEASEDERKKRAKPKRWEGAKNQEPKSDLQLPGHLHVRVIQLSSVLPLGPAPPFNNTF